MERYFEKISYQQFKKDIADSKKLYEEYKLPERKTKNSAGYDFFAIQDYTIKPGEIMKIPTGYKAYYQDDEMLLLVVRSSMGFKYNVRMCNQIGIIDSDFYNNIANEGHMWVALQNQGNKDYIIKKGDAYCQGIFVKYLTCDDKVEKIRDNWTGKPEERG